MSQSELIIIENPKVVMTRRPKVGGHDGNHKKDFVKIIISNQLYCFHLGIIVNSWQLFEYMRHQLLARKGHDL
jgi:hypothetical protein